MLDYHSAMVSALSAVLPTHYEMMLHSGLKTPCISYMELNNAAASETVNCSIGYSRITYQIKVWAQDIAEVQRYALEVDNALRPLGFKRLSSIEMHDKNSSMIQKVMTYEGLAQEIFLTN
jgi:hypothetical protein